VASKAPELHESGGLQIWQSARLSFPKTESARLAGLRGRKSWMKTPGFLQVYIYQRLVFFATRLARGLLFKAASSEEAIGQRPAAGKDRSGNSQRKLVRNKSKSRRNEA
jgi:hypothetical protein